MGQNNNKLVHIVHCVDTEGPLHESLTATFERLKNVFGLDFEPSHKNMDKIRQGVGIPSHLRSIVMDFVSEKRLNYNSNWNNIDLMLDEILTAKWRNKYADDFGNDYIFNWFIIDHVGFIINPRRRALGYHVIFEHYKEKLSEHNCLQDEIHWHFHPVSFFREAHHASNNFSFTNEHLQILSRRVIDHGWFPSAYRPGQHTERPDINLFLEQWIPFDYGNQGIAPEQDTKTDKQRDIANGRFGDWRRATTEWEVYHPDYYDYQLKGQMKRYLARCLNLNSRLREINDCEIEKAFRRADQGKQTILAITNHDEREMRPDVDAFYRSVRQIQKKYPTVKIKNSGAKQAIREALALPRETPLKFDISLKDNQITIQADKPCWGPQPYFCFKTKGNQYIQDNLDYHGGTNWSYTFDDETVNLNQLAAIGLATNDNYGNTTVWRQVR